MSVLLKIGGENYFIDLANVEKVLTSGSSNFKGGMVTETKTVSNLDADGNVVSKTVTAREFYKGKEVDGFRYETIRTMIEILLTTEGGDDISGLSKQDISFKIAFNTLIEYGILNIAE